MLVPLLLQEGGSLARVSGSKILIRARAKDSLRRVKKGLEKPLDLRARVKARPGQGLVQYAEWS